jgi:hypothetical protein
MGVGGQSHAPAALLLGKSLNSLYTRLGGQGRSGRMGQISPSTGIRYPDRPARSESLYRLSYPVPLAVFRCVQEMGAIKCVTTSHAPYNRC